jgi:hypothetical protein
MKALLRNCLGITLAAALAAPAYADDVTCTDGTTSESGRGACSHHGGIAKNADRTTRDDAVTPAPTRTRAHKPATHLDRDRTERDRDNTDRDRADRDRADRYHTDGEPVDRTREPVEDHDRESITHQGEEATARCNDGELSFSTHHSGTCSDHGGVAEWLDR